MLVRVFSDVLVFFPCFDICQILVANIRDVYLQGLASYLFHQYYCLRVNRVYAEINTFLPPFSKRLFIAMIHRKVSCLNREYSIYVEKILTEFTRISF